MPAPYRLAHTYDAIVRELEQLRARVVSQATLRDELARQHGSVAESDDAVAEAIALVLLAEAGFPPDAQRLTQRLNELREGAENLDDIIEVPSDLDAGARPSSAKVLVNDLVAAGIQRPVLLAALSFHQADEARRAVHIEAIALLDYLSTVMDGRAELVHVSELCHRPMQRRQTQAGLIENAVGHLESITSNASSLNDLAFGLQVLANARADPPRGGRKHGHSAGFSGPQRQRVLRTLRFDVPPKTTSGKITRPTATQFRELVETQVAETPHVFPPYARPAMTAPDEALSGPDTRPTRPEDLVGHVLVRPGDQGPWTGRVIHVLALGEESGPEARPKLLVRPAISPDKWGPERQVWFAAVVRGLESTPDDPKRLIDSGPAHLVDPNAPSALRRSAASPRFYQVITDVDPETGLVRQPGAALASGYKFAIIQRPRRTPLLVVSDTQRGECVEVVPVRRARRSDGGGTVPIFAWDKKTMLTTEQTHELLQAAEASTEEGQSHVRRTNITREEVGRTRLPPGIAHEVESAQATLNSAVDRSHDDGPDDLENPGSSPARPGPSNPPGGSNPGHAIPDTEPRIPVNKPPNEEPEAPTDEASGQRRYDSPPDMAREDDDLSPELREVAERIGEIAGGAGVEEPEQRPERDERIYRDYPSHGGR